VPLSTANAEAGIIEKIIATDIIAAMKVFLLFFWFNIFSSLLKSFFLLVKTVLF